MEYIYNHISTFPVLNLHLFGPTQTTELNQPGNDLSPEMKTYYHKRLIDTAQPYLAYDQFGAKYPIPKGGGKTIEMRRFSPLKKALKPLTEGVTPVGNKLNVTFLTAKAEQFGDYIEHSDMLEMTAIDPIILTSLDLLSSQSGRTLDTITREVVCAGSNKSFAPRINDDGTKTEVLLRENVTTACRLTPAEIRKGVAKLKRHNASPINGYFVAVIHPDVTCDIMGDREWIDAHQYTEVENIYEGEIGRYAKVRFVESTEAKIIGPAFFWGDESTGGACRLTLHTALDSNGSTNIIVREAISAAEAAELNARIQGGEEVRMYVGGKEATIASITAGDGGVAKFVTKTAVTDVEAGAMVCGYGAGKDGSAIYCTMLFAANAYGVTEIEGMGLEHIVKQKGSAGTADPLNQRSTVGWKATKTAERLVEEYMLRIEHSSETYGAYAVSN